MKVANFIRSCPVHIYLKPHFLFNALNAAKSLCRRDSQKASDLLASLSECLFYASESRPSIVYLSDELRFVQDYLCVQTLRFPRLKVRNAIDERAECMLPRFSLLILAENVVQHAVMYQEKPVNLKVEVERKDGIVLIAFEDDGPGMSEDRLQRIWSEESSLARLHEVLKTRGMQLQVFSRAGKGTAAVIKSEKDN